MGKTSIRTIRDRALNWPSNLSRCEFPIVVSEPTRLSDRFKSQYTWKCRKQVDKRSGVERLTAELKKVTEERDIQKRSRWVQLVDATPAELMGSAKAATGDFFTSSTRFCVLGF